MAVLTTKEPIRFTINEAAHELHGTEVTINCTSDGRRVRWWIDAPDHVRFERIKKPPVSGGGGRAA